ncbi:4Fe-4S binding protein [Lutibacter sp. B2]|nr:4Fe-4S binding protein [Lutibacter sp. B2]
MSILNFSKANCKNCYKCLRACPVKAIKIKNEQAEIVEDLCIGCGKCLIVCPQNARKVESDVQKVKEAILKGKRVIASIAPSFVGAFHMKEEGQVVTALKNLGVTIVEETAVGAEIVADLYEKKILEKKYKNYITTCCPAANYLVEKYFPNLTKYMIPIVSPMLAHGKILKRIYGIDSYIVFIGPCVAKKIESIHFQHEGVVDAVITFEELDHWLEEENILIENLIAQEFDRSSFERGRKFPIGGILESIEENKNDYEVLKVDGVHRCVELFESLESGNIENVCVEVNACRGGCVGGPGMPKKEKDFFKRQKRVKSYTCKNISEKNQDFHMDRSNIVFSKLFFNRAVNRKKASEEEIKSILRKIGKYEESDELNCGGCGYSTCKNKAQAVYEGMAEINMCLPFMRSKAESMTNIIFEHTPNAILLIDENLNIRELNKVAEKIFNVKEYEMKDQPISIILDDYIFKNVLENKKNVIGQKIGYKQYEIVLFQSVIYLEKEKMLLAIMTNITEEEKRKRELAIVKENTIEAAQKVIEKQMRVAQEIASLLGETTAETKASLTKLKKVILQENGALK